MAVRLPKSFKSVVELAVILAVILVCWTVAAEIEFFEWFTEYSRAHESWELDEIAMLLVISAFVSKAALIIRWRRLLRITRERDEAQSQAELHAWYDPLTGLANRRYFQARLETLANDIALHPRVIAIIDLDRFKPVNDLHGHAVGDAVLKSVAVRLGKEIDKDSMLARLGGDEFAIVFGAQTDTEQAERTTRRLISRLDAPFEVGNLSVNIGTSIGLACSNSDVLAREGLQHADKALYAAKRAGRGRLAWYDAELGRRSLERAKLEEDLRRALRDEEIFPFFQPVFNLHSGELRGFEVLARWKHPDRGDISPEIFIGIAEDTGLIGDLGWSILRQACRRAARWPVDLKLAVNISPKQFMDSGLVQKTTEILTEVGFDPSNLEFEITESAVIVDMDFANRAIRELQAMGVTVALDDFGTGFSSLSNLRHLPFDRLKIDRSFITNIAADPSNQLIVEGILSLAQGLKIGVTAEGIETESDLKFISGLSCELGQGFYFDKAVSGEEVDWLLDAWEDSASQTGEAAPQVQSQQWIA